MILAAGSDLPAVNGADSRIPGLQRNIRERLILESGVPTVMGRMPMPRVEVSRVT